MARAATKHSNNAPSVKWVGAILACGRRRQRLFVDGRETPYFIDSATLIEHRTQGDAHGLYGAGMHESKIRDRQGNPRYVAAVLGSGQKVAELKHRAEQYALEREPT